jgi:type II secretory pathway component PulF
LTSLDPLLRALLETAATTGDLENGLRRVIRDLEERWRDATQRFLSITSYALYVVVACAAGWAIVSFYSNMYSGLNAEYERHVHGR